MSEISAEIPSDLLSDPLKSPITLISHGRSGTSLLQNIFAAHPEIAVAGETADLIFSTWYSIERAKGIIPGLHEQHEHNRAVGWEERKARGVRALFNSIFNLDRKYWMQKPIGQPFVSAYLRQQKTSLDEWFTLYWNILDSVFPQGKFITILRHPCDVVLSAKSYWGREQQQVWRDIASMSRCILHKDSKITYAVSYDALIREPEPAIQALFDHLMISYNPAVLQALNYIYVPDQQGWKQDKIKFQHKIDQNFSHRDEWQQIDFSLVQKDDLAAIEQVWQRYGYALELPEAAFCSQA